MASLSLRVLSIVAPPLLVSLFACGVGDSENLFGKSGSGENGEGGAGATASSTSSDVGASTSDGGSPSGPGPGPSSSRSSSVSSSSSRASSTSSSSSGGGVSVACGPTECKIENQSACCWDNYQLNGPPQGECVQGPPEGDNCDTEYDGTVGSGAETRIECQLPSHCKDGEVCCGDRVLLDAGSAYYASTSCQVGCDQPDRVLCDPFEPTDLCPVGTFCVESQLLPPGYFICSN